MEALYEGLRTLTVTLIYGVIFLPAALEKFSARGVPPWFTAKFSGTLLGISAGALFAQFYFIAACEALVCVGLAVSLARREFLPGRARTVLRGALAFAALVFVMLAFGLRLSGDFNGLSQVFIYLAATLGISEMV